MKSITSLSELFNQQNSYEGIALWQLQGMPLQYHRLVICEFFT